MFYTILTIGLFIGSPTEIKETIKVNAEKSEVKWMGNRINKTHTGTISLKEGSLEIENDKLTGGSFIIDMTTIQEDEGQNKLVGHLKSDDFFSVNSYPDTKLDITKVVHQGGNRYKIIADATIKGTTKELKFVATLDKDGDVFTAYAKFTFDRSEFNVKYGSGSFFDELGDKVIYDDIEITVNLVTGS
jgi:polyisoprenoid-binding protein YceI